MWSQLEELRVARLWKACRHISRDNLEAKNSDFLLAKRMKNVPISLVKTLSTLSFQTSQLVLFNFLRLVLVEVLQACDTLHMSPQAVRRLKCENGSFADRIQPAVAWMAATGVPRGLLHLRSDFCKNLQIAFTFINKKETKSLLLPKFLWQELFSDSPLFSNTHPVKPWDFKHVSSVFHIQVRPSYKNKCPPCRSTSQPHAHVARTGGSPLQL